MTDRTPTGPPTIHHITPPGALIGFTGGWTPPQPAAVSEVDGALALDLSLQVTPPPRALRLTTQSDLVEADRRARAELDAFAQRFVAIVVEVCVAERALTQLLRHCTPSVYAQLGRRIDALKAINAASPTPRGSSVLRPRVASVRTSLVHSTALEVSARYQHGERSRALAARLEVIRDRWQCVDLHIG